MKNPFFTIVMVFLIVAVSGYFLKNSLREQPNVSMLNYYNDILHLDNNYIKENRMTYSDAIGMYFCRKNNFRPIKSQSYDIGKAIMESMKKINVETKKVSVNGDVAEVEIKYDYFDTDAIYNQFPYKYTTSTDVYVERLTEKIKNNMQPVGSRKFIVKCSYDESSKKWVPENEKIAVEDFLLAVAGYKTL